MATTDSVTRWSDTHPSTSEDVPLNTSTLGASQPGSSPSSRPADLATASGLDPTSVTSAIPASATPTPSWITATDEETSVPFCMTAMARTCVSIALNSYGEFEETVTVPFGSPLFASLILSTYSSGAITSVVPISTAAPVPAPTWALTPAPMPTPIPVTPIATSPALSNGSSAPTRIQGSLAVASYNSITASAPLPPPSSPLVTDSPQILTRWATHTVIDGSTVSGIAVQVGVRSTVIATYQFGSHTLIPISAVSLASIESVRTSLPSPTMRSDQTADGRSHEAARVTGIVVGSLTGMMLLGTLLLVYLKGSRRGRTPDYASRRAPLWKTETTFESSNRSVSASTLDLNSEPQLDTSVVEPWIEQSRLQPGRHVRSGKMQQYMGGQRRGEEMVTTAAVGVSFYRDVPRSSKNRATAHLRPEPVAPPLPGQSDVAPVQSPPASAPSPNPSSSQSRTPQPQILAHHQPIPAEDPPRTNAIPPLYNEAWNMQRG